MLALSDEYTTQQNFYFPQRTSSLTIPDLLQTLCEVANKVKEEVFLGYANHHVTDLNKHREPLRAVQTQMFSNATTYVFGTCVGANFNDLLREVKAGNTVKSG